MKKMIYLLMLVLVLAGCSNNKATTESNEEKQPNDFLQSFVDEAEKKFPNHERNNIVCQKIYSEFEEAIKGKNVVDVVQGVEFHIVGELSKIDNKILLYIAGDNAHIDILCEDLDEDLAASLSVDKIYRVTEATFDHYEQGGALDADFPWINLGKIYVKDIKLEEVPGKTNKTPSF